MDTTHNRHDTEGRPEEGLAALTAADPAEAPALADGLAADLAKELAELGAPEAAGEPA